jgi:hypothetical protein
MEIYIHTCRDVKDKIVTGGYRIKVTIRERIGGYMLKYMKA